MSNQTSRVEAATAGVLEQRSRVINPTWEQCLTAALAAADADDLANGIRRVRKGDELRAAALALEALGPMTKDQYIRIIRLYADEPWRLSPERAVLAAATDGADG